MSLNDAISFLMPFSGLAFNVRQFQTLVLMEESKLTMLQRKMIQEAVDKGESLPPSIDRKKTKDDDKATGHYCVNIATLRRNAAVKIERER